MVTVLVATLNGEKYLDAQLESLVNQTYRDLRIVIRDDGSSDKTMQIIDKYREIYSDKIEVCPTSSSTGSIAGSFLKLLEEYTDDYVMLSNQDDIWLPEKVEKTLLAMKKAEDRLSADTPLLVHTDLYFTDEKLKKLSDSFVNFQRLSPNMTELNNMLMQNSITGCTVMINRALKERLFVLPHFSSPDWWLGIIAAAFGEIIFLNTPTVLHRRHSCTKKAIEQVGAGYKIIFKQAEFLAENYADMLSIKQKKLLAAVASLPKLSRINKIKTVRKYSLYQNTLLKNIIQFISI